MGMTTANRRPETRAEWQPCKIDNRKALTNIDAIEQVVMLAEGSALCPTFFRVAKRPLEYLAKRLMLTKEQVALFSVFVNFSDRYQIELRDISEFLGCTQIEILRRASDLEYLRRLRYIWRTCSSSQAESYLISQQALSAIKDNREFAGIQTTNLTINQFFEHLKKYFSERDASQCDSNELTSNIDKLLEDNKHLMFVTKLKEYKLDKNSQLMLLQGCNMYVNSEDTVIALNDITSLYEYEYIARDIITKLNNNDHPLLTLGLLKHFGDDVTSPDYYELGRVAIEELLVELNLSIHKQHMAQHIISHSDICAKQLFYNERERRRIEELESLLCQERFKAICDRLEAKGFRRGFAILLYGAPGTGKTETALQIARTTGRDIIDVNVSELRNMYVGESEKSVKRLFSHYRTIVAESEVAPILLFNEADAIISKRSEDISHAVDKMENALQNIILQEMETLEGILIATTNLTQNMDRAFERRFLYKIEFHAPELQTRCAIWQSMLPTLCDADAMTLAHTYDFSGGQIENIARKCTVAQILSSSDTLPFETIRTLCNEERLDSLQNRRLIGF